MPTLAPTLPAPGTHGTRVQLVPLDIKTALLKIADRFRHAADLAEVCADGSLPERGAEHVLEMLSESAPEFIVLAQALSGSEDPALRMAGAAYGEAWRWMPKRHDEEPLA